MILSLPSIYKQAKNVDMERLAEDRLEEGYSCRTSAQSPVYEKFQNPALLDVIDSDKEPLEVWESVLSRIALGVIVFLMASIFVVPIYGITHSRSTARSVADPDNMINKISMELRCPDLRSTQARYLDGIFSVNYNPEEDKAETRTIGPFCIPEIVVAGDEAVVAERKAERQEPGSDGRSDGDERQQVESDQHEFAVREDGTSKPLFIIILIIIATRYVFLVFILLLLGVLVCHLDSRNKEELRRKLF